MRYTDKKNHNKKKPFFKSLIKKNWKPYKEEECLSKFVDNGFLSDSDLYILCENLHYILIFLFGKLFDDYVFDKFCMFSMFCILTFVLEETSLKHRKATAYVTDTFIG